MRVEKQRVDINNLNDDKKKSDHLYSDIMGQERAFRAPATKQKKDTDSTQSKKMQHSYSVAN